jgi:hypothetical protein
MVKRPGKEGRTKSVVYKDREIAGAGAGCSARKKPDFFSGGLLLPVSLLLQSAQAPSPAAATAIYSLYAHFSCYIQKHL